MDGGACWAAVHGVAKSQTRLSNFTFTFHFHALEKEMATHSSVLAWRIPGMGEPGGLPSMGSHRVRHDWSDLAAAAKGTEPAQAQLSGHLLYQLGSDPAPDRAVMANEHRKSCLTAHTDSCSSNTSHMPYQGDSGQHKLRRMWLLSTLNLALTPKILGTQSTKGHFHIKMPLKDHNR